MDTDETSQNTAEDGVPNDASGVSDNRSRETLPQQELLAIGGEIEDEHSNTTLAEAYCNPPAQQPPAPLRSQFHRSSNSETCDCTMGNTTVAHLNGVKCCFCGRVIKTRRNLTVEESLATSTRETEPCVSALSETLVTGFARISQTPQPSLDGNQSTQVYEPRDQRSALLPVELNEAKVPIENYSDTSVQIPCVSSTLTLFILKQTHQATNEQQFSIYFTDSFQKRRIPAWIKQMEEHHGLKLVAFGDEQLSQTENQHLHHICLEDSVTLKFELVKQMLLPVLRKFRIRDAQATHKVPLHRIQSLCQNRIPGPTVRVCVQSLCGPGEVCQDHLRMTLEYGKTTCRMLIPIWSSGQP